MQQAIVNRFSSLGMFGSALVPSFNDDDDDDEDDDEENSDLSRRRSSQSKRRRRIRKRRKGTSLSSISSTDLFDDIYGSRGQTLRSLRWVILVFLFIMIFMSLHIYTEDLKYFEESKQYSNRSIPLIFVMFTMLLIGIGFYGVYHVKMYYTFTFAILMSIMLILKMNTDYWQQNSLNSIIFHIAHFIALFCSWAFSFLGACYFC
ncbi:hypothetical protein DERP_009817 [Dermatophagoides pteronyssinus]|uniref:Uncharacterized protein n=1 Tax=Dermatophagoides pteronyssinus TaxID=6956 RepID=A0ABQ8IR83_DERPT|nr:hypothetical protein DERP_009817 [Dermatophagoides pteronyssinus]